MTSHDRPSVDTVLMEMAAVWSTRSTCSRGQTGCVIARDGRVVSTGYNGAPAGMPHCDHSCDCSQLDQDVMNVERELKRAIFAKHHSSCRSLQPCTTAVHAEVNAIAFAARHGVATDGTTLYTLFSPCSTCAALIINAGVVRVVVERERGPSPNSLVGSGRALLEQAGIGVEVVGGERERTP